MTALDILYAVTCMYSSTYYDSYLQHADTAVGIFQDAVKALPA
jgi:hypothetical protein